MKKFVVIAPFILAGALSSAIAEEKINFEKEIYPFIKNSCVECHRAPYEKLGRLRPPKADLRFDAAWGIVKGGELGVIVVPGEPDKSPMYTRTMLDEDHDDFMPPLGDPLTEEQKELLKKWIEQGADFGDWKGENEDKPADAKEAFEKE